MHNTAMDLAKWLDEHDLTDAAFAERVGCNQTTINRAKRGITMPEAGLIDRIEGATNGAVTAADLFATVRAAKRASGPHSQPSIVAA